MKVNPGACGFEARIIAEKEAKRRVRIRIESECEHVCAVSLVLEAIGPLGIREIMGTGCERNPVLKASEERLAHSACPLPAAIIKAAEVELGLNVPVKATIEFAEGPENL